MMTKLLSFLQRRVPAEPIDASTRALSEALGNACPRCKQGLQSHSYQRFATTVAAEQRREELFSFIQTARQCDWAGLSKSHEFDPMENAVEVFALSCPDGLLSMLLVRSPFELYDSQTLEAWEPLPEQAAANWKALLLEANWEVFGT